jgi:shikimate dehydrogenase
MTERYVVIGNPVSHSQSPRIHMEFARQTGQDLNYERLLAPVDRFAEVVHEFQRQGGKGASVTIPFKHAAWQLATQRSDRAQLAQAVNTLSFSGDQIFGDNTDGSGFVRDLQQNLGYSIKNKRVLLMGAGGTTCGLLFPILSEKPTNVIVANRDMRKAIALVERFRSLGNVDCSSYVDLSGKQFDLVINATAASLHSELPPLPSGVFAKDAMAYDMMYGGQSKPFLDFASQQGAAVGADGLGMLVEQAAESFSIWRKVWPDTAPVIELLRASL